MNLKAWYTSAGGSCVVVDAGPPLTIHYILGLIKCTRDFYLVMLRKHKWVGHCWTQCFALQLLAVMSWSITVIITWFELQRTVAWSSKLSINEISAVSQYHHVWIWDGVAHVSVLTGTCEWCQVCKGEVWHGARQEAGLWAAACF